MSTTILSARIPICLAALCALASISGPAAARQPPDRHGDIEITPAASADGRPAVGALDPGGAAERDGLRPGDVFVEIQGAPVPNFQRFAQAILTIPANEPVEIVVERDGEPVTVAVTPIPRAIENIPGADSIYEWAQSPNGEWIRTISTFPPSNELSRDGRLPLVFLIQGINCNSVEAFGPNSLNGRVIEHLNAAGFATLRAEKPGIGDSTGTPCLEGGFSREVDAYVAALEQRLKSRADRVDPDRVYIVGISMGGIQSPLVAERVPVAGIISWGASATPWFDYVNWTLREQRLLAERDDFDRADKELRELRFVLSEMMIYEKSPEQIRAADPERFARVEAIYGDIEHFAGRHYTFHQELDEAPLWRAWTRFEGRVLAAHGEYDRVSIPADHQRVETLANKRHPGAAEFRYIPDVVHGMAAYDSLEQAFSAPGAGRRSDNFHDAMTAWLLEVDREG